MTIAAENFTFVADLVRRRSAISLAPGKEYLVESRLLPLARSAGRTVDEYVAGLRTRTDLLAQELVVEAMTTNETSWFRDLQPFDALSKHIVPSILETPRVAPLRIWSAACSTGQEPYSIAMTLEDVLPVGTRAEITATDLSAQVLAKAEAGAYSQLEVNRGLPAKYLVSHFTRQGAQWVVNPELRRKVRFLRHNLLDSPPTGGPFDIVFLRNVLIYFELPVKQDILRRLRSVVRPGGYLLLGAAETTVGIDDAWTRVQVDRGSVYRLGSGSVQ